MNETEWKPLLEIMQSQNGNIGARMLASFSFDPNFLAGMCTVLFESMINLIPENKQIEFERVTIETLQRMLEVRHNYITLEKFTPNN